MKLTKVFWTSFFWMFCATVMGQNAKVIRIADGDTYKLLVKGKIITARIANVDAPELKQQYGIAAKQQVSQLILGKDVQIDSVGTDMYKRELVNIRVNGERLDSIMVRNGLAWQYIEYSNDTMLANCEQLAISEAKGLWKCGAQAACPPWLFRKYNYRNIVRYCNGCKQ